MLVSICYSGLCILGRKCTERAGGLDEKGNKYIRGSCNKQSLFSRFNIFAWKKFLTVIG